MTNYIQCSATSKRTGERCKARAVTGANTCYHHGGRTPAGIAAPNFTHGRYSKHLPQRLLERFEASLVDNDLLNLRAEIALLDTRLEDVLKRVDSGEAGVLWKRASDLYADLRRTMVKQDAESVIELMSELDGLFSHGVGDYAAWGEIIGLLEQRRKLVESERRRMVELEQIITAEQATMLVSALLESVRSNVSDRSVLTAIQADFIRLTTGANRQRISADPDA